MAERRLIVDHLKLNYKGLFSMNELYNMVDRWFMQKGFDKREMFNREHVRPDGKFIELEIQPWKKITDYAKLVIRVHIVVLNMKDSDIEKDGQKLILNKGNITVTFDAYLVTDYEHRWENRPFYYFIRTVFDKYVYKGYMEQWEEELKSQTYELHDQIKSFLNLYRF